MCFLDSNRSSHLTNGLPQGFFWLREPSFGAAVGGHSIPCAISWCDRRPWQALDSCQDTALAFGIKDCEAAVSRCLLVAGFHLNWHLQGLLPCLQYMYTNISIHQYRYYNHKPWIFMALSTVDSTASSSVLDMAGVFAISGVTSQNLDGLRLLLI